MEALGIDVKLFLGQILNFLILLLILWLFAYKPIVKMLEDRRKRVAESLENAKKIEEDLAKTEEKTQAMLLAARSETEKLIESSSKAATAEKKEIIEIAKTQAQKEIEKGKLAINQERELASKKLQQEVASLVRLATEKILAKQVSPAEQKEAIDEAIDDLGGVK